MADSHVVGGLKAKQEEIKKRISSLKKEIKICRDELEAVNRTLRIFVAAPRTGGNRLFRRGDMPRLILDALRANPEGLDIDQLAGIVIDQEGFDAADPEMAATIRQRCAMAMYRYVDRSQVVKERRGSVRVWRLA